MKNKYIIVKIVIVILFFTSCQRFAGSIFSAAGNLSSSPALFISNSPVTHTVSLSRQSRSTKMSSFKLTSSSWPKSTSIPSPLTIPKLDRKTVFKNSAASIDLSYISYGFIKARLVKPVSQKIKIGVQHGSRTYYYDLKNNGGTEVYPLQMGNGSYSLTVYQNTSGKIYTSLLSTNIKVNLSNQFDPYLVPNQIINYSSGSHAAALAKKLVRGKSNNYDRISTVLSYVSKNISYDYKLAKAVKNNYVPNIDNDLAKGKGICYDYAAISAAMLRSLGYPTKLLMGYINKGAVYHAWNEVYIKGQGWVNVFSVTLNTSNWSIIDTTFISTSTSKSTIANYIKNSGNYQADKIY